MTSEISSSHTRNRASHTCVRCAERKVKCDRQRPCNACTKHNVECVFNSVQAPRKRQKRVKLQHLSDRLKVYETVLQQQGVDPSSLPERLDSRYEPSSDGTRTATASEAQIATPRSIEDDLSRSINKTQVVQGQGQRSQLIDNSLWTRVAEEVLRPDDAWENSSDSDDLDSSDEDFQFVLKTNRNDTKSKRKYCHPASDHIFQLWQIFVENVDPLTKIVHVPTVQLAVERAAQNAENVPRSCSALLFAIYSTAVMSLTDHECQQRFKESRKILLSHYMSATKSALATARFMSTKSLVVLQALTLHLISVRNMYEPRAVWTLTGVAIRIAQVMGLDRDGEILGLPPFETEIRRRVWWFLKTHDYRTAELCGLSKFRYTISGEDSTKRPSSIDDHQLRPGITSFEARTDCVTDFIFVALKYELAVFATNVAGKPRGEANDDNFESGRGVDEMEIACREIEETLETKYLRYCDPSQPLQLMAMVMARIAINTVRFLRHHPRRWTSLASTPPEERQIVWDISLRLLEQYTMAQTNPALQRFVWNGAYFQQWHALIHVLDSLRAEPLTSNSEKAWRIIAEIYRTAPDLLLDAKKPIHVAVGNLCLKAYEEREAALRGANLHVPEMPVFISQVKRKREVATARRRERNTKRQQDRLQSETEPGVSTRSNIEVAKHFPLRQASESGGLSGTNQGHHANSLLDNDPFWSLNGFDDGHFSGAIDGIDMDLDFVLEQDPFLEESAARSITWDRWDAWLEESNAM